MKLKKNKQNIWANTKVSESLVNKKETIDFEDSVSLYSISEKIIVKEKIIYKKEPKFSHSKSRRKSAFFIIAAILITLSFIIIPFAILFSLTPKIINKIDEVTDTSGFRVGSTWFSIKHIDSGKYISAPTSELENLHLEEGKEKNGYSVPKSSDDLFKFEYKKTDKETELWIQSQFYQGYSVDSNGEEVHDFLTMEIVDSNPVWTSENQNKGISLEKKNDEDLYGIKFESNEMYLSKNENTDQLELSWTPDWFEIHAYVAPITTTSEYIEDYNFLNSNQEGISDVEIGIDGNPISIQSTKTGLFLNSSGISFWSNKLNQNNSKESFIATDNEEFNFFMPKTKNEDIVLGSYSTLNPYKYYDEKQCSSDYYPTFFSSENEISLYSELKSHRIPSLGYNSTSDNAKTGSKIWLIQNPLNLREKAIYFIEDFNIENYILGEGSLKKGKFLNTSSDGSIYLSEEREYFLFKQSSLQSPENFTFELMYGSKYDAYYELSVENPKSVDKFNIKLYGFNNMYDTNNWQIYQIIEKTVRPKERTEKVKIDDLDGSLRYYGYIVLNREKEAGLHKTIRLFTLMPPDNDHGEWWGWDGWKVIEDIDPSNIRLWDSSAEGDVSIENSGTEIEISLEFEQGNKKQRVDEVKVGIQESDESGQINEGSQEQYDSVYPSKSEILKFNFYDLKPNTYYLVKVYWTYDDKDSEFQGEGEEISHNEGISIMTVKTERNFVEVQDYTFEKVSIAIGPEEYWFNTNIINLLDDDILTIEFKGKNVDGEYINLPSYGVNKEEVSKIKDENDNSFDTNNDDNTINLSYNQNSIYLKNDCNKVQIIITINLSGYETEWGEKTTIELLNIEEDIEITNTWI